MFGAGMTINDVITLVSNRLAALNQAHATAVALGDVQRMAALEVEIVETQSTIDALRSLT
jgi:hypothetical protein